MSKTILAVDDSRTMRDMVEFTLKSAGYGVVLAEDGQKGLEKLAANRVDVIITDINMPVMDGITFVREVRKQDRFKATPILILTTESSQDMKDKGRAAGATGWIVKPFDPQKLLAVIGKVSP